MKVRYGLIHADELYRGEFYSKLNYEEADSAVCVLSVCSCSWPSSIAAGASAFGATSLLPVASGPFFFVLFEGVLEGARTICI